MFTCTTGLIAVVAFPFLVPAICGAVESSAARSAVESVTVADLRRHAAALADDTFEGREAGTRGGRAAAGYLEGEFKRLGLKPAGVKGSYFQVFDGNSRNILGLLEGSDPKLKDEIVLAAAHYDHVGYGNARTSYGPTGFIHNGADDNASGVATLMEVAEACAKLDPRPKRSILFALWDGEEKGLLGSKHWVAHPTIPLSKIRIDLNMDMVGRLRNNKLELIGSRTARGLRKLASLPNTDEPIVLDFTWEIRNDSDHHPFYASGIPFIMPHTGLHSDYHRPSDDVEKLNLDGMRRIGRYVVGLTIGLADLPELPRFREAARRETKWNQPSSESVLPAAPPRLGLNWDPKDVAAPGLKVMRVAPGSPAAEAGVRPGDRVLSFADQEIMHDTDLAAIVLSAKSPAPAKLQREGAEEPIDLEIKLRGTPTRLGLSWREEEAEPGSVKLVRVISGSLGAKAGLRPLDRIYAVNGKEFANSNELVKILADTPTPFSLSVERLGHIRTVDIGPPQTAAK
ncbi:MAG TPA: M20/M25/M40 family metallo-hydrolase [Pirellulales bacterium]|jgi:hypothetical protein